MRKLICFCIVLSMLMLLTACGHHEPQMLYSDDACTVIRVDRSVTVSDAQTGQQCTFTLQRVKRNSAPNYSNGNTVSTDNLTIRAAFDVLLITKHNGDGESFFIKIR